MTKCLYIATITYLDLQEMSAETFILGASKRANDAKRFIISNLEGKVEKDFYGNLICPFGGKNGKVTVASEEEIARNPRSRSAKLRIATKIESIQK